MPIRFGCVYNYSSLSNICDLKMLCFGMYLFVQSMVYGFVQVPSVWAAFVLGYFDG